MAWGEGSQWGRGNAWPYWHASFHGNQGRRLDSSDAPPPFPPDATLSSDTLALETIAADTLTRQPTSNRLSNSNNNNSNKQSDTKPARQHGHLVFLAQGRLTVTASVQLHPINNKMDITGIADGRECPSYQATLAHDVPHVYGNTIYGHAANDPKEQGCRTLQDAYVGRTCKKPWQGQKEEGVRDTKLPPPPKPTLRAATCITSGETRTRGTGSRTHAVKGVASDRKACTSDSATRNVHARVRN